MNKCELCGKRNAALMKVCRDINADGFHAQTSSDDYARNPVFVVCEDHTEDELIEAFG